MAKAWRSENGGRTATGLGMGTMGVAVGRSPLLGPGQLRRSWFKAGILEASFPYVSPTPGPCLQMSEIRVSAMHLDFDLDLMKRQSLRGTKFPHWYKGVVTGSEPGCGGCQEGKGCSKKYVYAWRWGRPSRGRGRWSLT